MSARRHPAQATANQRVREDTGGVRDAGDPRRPPALANAGRFPGRQTRMPRMSRFSASTLLVAGLATGLGATGSAQDTDTPTVNVGDPAPDFELKDAHGASYRLSELLERGPVVLEFFRSGGW